MVMCQLIVAARERIRQIQQDAQTKLRLQMPRSGVPHEPVFLTTLKNQQFAFLYKISFVNLGG
jgi:hypothetical protein